MIQSLLPLSHGHMALVLASGMLDGRIVMADGSTVIVKAISGKQQYQKSDAVTMRSGIVYRAVVNGERPMLRLRVLSADGVITEFS